MIAYQEVTDWGARSDLINHVYLVDGDKILAYLPRGGTVPFYFTKPIQFDRRGRKFTALKHNPFKATAPSAVVKVKGSRGETYEVDPTRPHCSCVGFGFRGTCRHLKEVMARNQVN
jgi:hypothetical protein